MTEQPKLESFLKAKSRHHLVISRGEVPGLNYIDVGQSVAKKLQKEKSFKKIGLKTHSLLDHLMQGAVAVEGLDLKYVALKNIGILLEPELGINFQSFLSSYSQNTALFLLWEGEYEDGKLYFLSKDRGVEINIKDISHITI